MDKSRKTGIDIVGIAPWGTHFCQFYSSKKDLIDILVPYIKAGLENNEYCMWITSEPLPKEKAIQALKNSLPGIDYHIKKKQIEMIAYDEWYLKNGLFDSERVLTGWIEKLNKALSHGFEGLRLTGNTSWLKKKDWMNFTDYEVAINNVIGKYKMLALCSYCLDKCSATDILDVVSNHEFALIRNGKKWQLFENYKYKETREALVKSKEGLGKLYLSMSEGVALHEILYNKVGKAIDYIISDVNPAYEAITGLKKDEALGKKATVLYKTKNPPYLDIYADVAATGKASNFETYFPPMQKYFNISVFSNEKGRFATVFSDITQRKESEEVLKESEARYLNILETANEGILLTDNNAIVKFCNSKMEEMLGYTNKELIGMSSLELLIPDDAKVREEILEKRKKGIKDNYEQKLMHKDGSYTWFLISGTPIIDKKGNHTGNLGMFIDISDQKKLEEKLSYLSSFPELNPMPICEIDNSGNLLYLNAAIKNIFQDIESSGTKHPFLADIDGIFKSLELSDNNLLSREIQFEDKYYEQIFTSVEDLRRIRIYSRDITKRKEAEDEILLLNRSLAQRSLDLEAVNKELEAFSYSVSHDLRAPLRAIDGFSKILLEEYSNLIDDEGQRLFKIIRTNIKKMGQLIDDLLGLSHLGRKEITSSYVNMEEIVSSVKEELKSLYPERKINIEIKRMPSAIGDPGMLRQVWVNLISNAIKFSKPKEKAIIEIGGNPVKNSMVYYVKDNGVGFNMQYANKLFGIFQRLHSQEEFEGTGIGLAIVAQIIKKHGGEVWAESELQKGAKFYFSLPITK